MNLPLWAVADLVRRRARGIRLDQPVFSNSIGGFRDPKNTRRDLRAALDRAGLSWAIHNFRKTTATMLDEAGLSTRLMADQLIDTRKCQTLRDVYMGRKACGCASR